jgi:hypothetical protein
MLCNLGLVGENKVMIIHDPTNPVLGLLAPDKRRSVLIDFSSVEISGGLLALDVFGFLSSLLGCSWLARFT